MWKLKDNDATRRRIKKLGLSKKLDLREDVRMSAEIREKIGYMYLTFVSK